MNKAHSIVALLLVALFSVFMPVNAQSITAHAVNSKLKNNLTVTGTLTVGSSTAITKITAGSATLASGTVSVADTSIGANSIVVVTSTNVTGETFQVVNTAGTGFAITSSNASSTAVVNYIRIN